jgi:aromatic-L-amino-acid decarboxylase
MIRDHVEMGKWFEEQVIAHPDFELILPRVLNVVVFRHIANDDPNEFNKQLVEKLNSSGEMYVSHTVLNKNYAIRMVTGNTRVQMEHVEKSWQQIVSSAQEIILNK